MFNNIFGSILSSSGSFSPLTFLVCTLFSLFLGLIISCVYRFRNPASKSFVVTLALLPAMVQMVIILVNGSLGTAVAIAGSFSLIRFRSVPGTAKEIISIFFAMATGLATGMGYLFIALLFVVILGACMMIYNSTRFGEPKRTLKELRITIPEDLDYTGVFDDLFDEYATRCTLVEVKTVNMGSLFRLKYRLLLKDAAREKEFIDALRCRNGNLEISCGHLSASKEAL